MDRTAAGQCTCAKPTANKLGGPIGRRVGYELERVQPVVWGNYKLLESYHSQTVVREGNDLVIAERIGPRHWCCYAGPSRADSEPTEQTFRLTCDEKPHPLDAPASGTVICKYLSSTVVDGQTVYEAPDVLLGKTKVLYWRTEISSDGEKMSDSAYKDAGRKKLLYRSIYYRKQ